MKKTTTKKVASSTKKVVAKVTAKKVARTLVEPMREYTKAEVKSILGLSSKTHMTTKKGYTGFEGRGKILGEKVIAFIPKSRLVKVSRKYPSGKVCVVSR